MEKQSILFVDDEESILEIAKEFFEQKNYKVFTAGNGLEAIALLDRERIDCCFTDINMPIMGGVEMIKKLAEDDVLMDVPIIVVSTEGSKSRIDQLKKNGVSAYLRKPVTPEQLRDIVFDLIGGE